MMIHLSQPQIITGHWGVSRGLGLFALYDGVVLSFTFFCFDPPLGKTIPVDEYIGQALNHQLDDLFFFSILQNWLWQSGTKCFRDMYIMMITHLCRAFSDIRGQCIPVMIAIDYCVLVCLLIDVVLSLLVLLLLMAAIDSSRRTICTI